MKKAFGYARTATIVASTNFNSIENQTKRIKDYCRKKNIELVKMFTDSTKSGIKLNRPALNSLLKSIKKTPVNNLVIADFDRLSRDVRQFLTINRLLKKANIEILAVNPNQTEPDPYAKFVDLIVESVDALYGKIIEKRRLYKDCSCEFKENQKRR